MGFLGDDPRHPVVIGMCHSSAKPAPEPPKDANHRKGYVSRASMRLTFDDEKKIVVLETPAGNRLTLSEDAKAVTIEDQNGNSIRLEQGGITIESSKDLKLKAPGRDDRGGEHRAEGRERIQGVGHRKRRGFGSQHDHPGKRQHCDQGRHGADQLNQRRRDEVASGSPRQRYDRQHGQPRVFLYPYSPRRCNRAYRRTAGSARGDTCGRRDRDGLRHRAYRGMPAARIADLTAAGEPCSRPERSTCLSGIGMNRPFLGRGGPFRPSSTRSYPA